MGSPPDTGLHPGAALSADLQLGQSEEREMLYLTTHSTHFYLRLYGVRQLGQSKEREMFYLTTHSTHFYLRLYGVRHMVKDHSDSERGRKEGRKGFI